LLWTAAGSAAAAAAAGVVALIALTLSKWRERDAIGE
jgi:hypothetical protein